MKRKKRVIQISLDIFVDFECDGFVLAEDVAKELEKQGLKVIGAAFQDDMTECYKEQYPELLEV